MIWKFRWHILHNTAGQGSEGSWRSPHLLCRCLEKDRPGVPPGAATPGVPQPPAHPCTHTVPGQHPPSLCFLPPVACRSSWGRGVQWEGPTFLQYLSCQILPALDIHHVIQSPLHSYEVDSISVLWMRKLKLRRIKEFAPSHTDCEKRSWSWHQSVFHSKTYILSTEAPFLLPEG